MAEDHCKTFGQPLSGQSWISMNKNNHQDFGRLFIKQAKKYGASLAGIADAGATRQSPSHVFYGSLKPLRVVGIRTERKMMPGPVAWPETARSIVVIALEHPEGQPELDWWRPDIAGGTSGNRALMQINARLARWIREEIGAAVTSLPYQIEKGGIFLKDAAVMAGLGCIGRNNMLITPDFGPRVRLRAMLLNVALPPTGPVDFDPCHTCDMPCRPICPQEAFQNKIYSKEALGLSQLPGRNGVYARSRCNTQMELDIDQGDNIRSVIYSHGGKQVKYCRQCEFSCPVGR